MSMVKRKRRTFKPAFKRELVELCRQGDRSIGQVAKDLGITETSIRRWVRQHEIDIGEGPAGALTTSERDELKRLRRENRRLREDREILRKATVFFAKESE
jgi:transposase